ncbi:shikimate dehydrogenase [Legionella shakespearei]|uniref:Shikimate dehydrogenase (NADP(+)) n=1 Tax=Legionella shakespearei DSM 23087 TaxID=1122169 RepID=A0A0W0YQG4_9GAMM|nr:shikimate dehydrogenase [Legionella shakespearei]KTD59148.1 shikimate 5-dehydrogenase [Legionella shakespearei DSM 23087]
MKRFAVVGNPIAHSVSPVIHQHFAEQCKMSLSYEKMLGDDVVFEEQITTFFRHNGSGLNITLPYKQRAFALASQATERCKRAGAANTLWMSNAQLHADNTDGIGLVRDLLRYMELNRKSILILGGGGAARGIIYPLLEMAPASLTVAIRSIEKADELQQTFPKIEIIGLNQLNSRFDLVINATSASLSDDALELPKALMSHHPFCYDLSYKLKEDTSFVHYAKSQGCEAVDGLGMLVEQAAESFFIWNGVLPETETIFDLLRQQTN